MTIRHVFPGLSLSKEDVNQGYMVNDVSKKPGLHRAFFMGFLHDLSKMTDHVNKMFTLHLLIVIINSK